MSQSKKKNSPSIQNQSLKDQSPTSPSSSQKFDIIKASKYLNQRNLMKTKFLEFEVVSKQVNDKNVQKFKPKKDYEINSFNFNQELNKFKI